MCLVFICIHTFISLMKTCQPLGGPSGHFLTGQLHVESKMGNTETKRAMDHVEQIREDVRAICEKTRELADQHMVQSMQRELWKTHVKLDRILVKLTDTPELGQSPASSLSPPPAGSLSPRYPAARTCSPGPDPGRACSPLYWAPSPTSLPRKDVPRELPPLDLSPPVPQPLDLTLPKSLRTRAPFSRSARKSRSYQNLAAYPQADLPLEPAPKLHIRTDEEGYVCPSF